jgi:ADP-heptose:LPS heptosyltransferase
VGGTWLGDCIIITPALKRLKELGYYIILDTSERGESVLRHCPHINEFIVGVDGKKNSVELQKYWKELHGKLKPDRYINFSESIECNVALHPVSPRYIYPKYERYETCNRNYYDTSEQWAKLEGCQKTPILYFTKEEEKKVQGYLQEGKFNILWCLSGSGRQKVYPWTEFIMSDALKNLPGVHFITVGDERCKFLEMIDDTNVTNLSGEIDIREAMCLTKYVQLVVSPDTGILHASGCYDTPKIGLLGHTTKENITKYFKNDYSIEAKCACAPCFRLIYGDHSWQCPVDPVTHASWCMSVGLDPKRVYEQIESVYGNWARAD